MLTQRWLWNRGAGESYGTEMKRGRKHLLGSHGRTQIGKVERRQRTFSMGHSIPASQEVLMLRSMPTNKTIARTRLVWCSAPPLPKACPTNTLIQLLHICSVMLPSIPYLFILLAYTSAEVLPLYFLFHISSCVTFFWGCALSMNTIINDGNLQLCILVSGGALYTSTHALGQWFSSACMYGSPT